MSAVRFDGIVIPSGLSSLPFTSINLRLQNNILENAEIKERVKKGLDLTFEKLLKTKSQANGVFVLSQNGVIKKVKASDLLTQ